MGELVTGPEKLVSVVGRAMENDSMSVGPEVDSTAAVVGWRSPLVRTRCGDEEVVHAQSIVAHDAGRARAARPLNFF